MPLVDPELWCSRLRAAVRGLLLCAVTLVLVAALAPPATAQEVQDVPAATTADVTPAPAAEQPADTGSQSEPQPVATDPAPQPEPQPEPQPPPPETPQPVDSAPQAPSSDQPVPDRTPSRDSASHPAPATSQPAITTFTAPPAPAAPLAGGEQPPPTTAPLGWDVYDDALFAETLDGDETAALPGSGTPPSISGLGVLAIAHPSERDRRNDVEPPSRANATPAGGSGPGGQGPGPGPSLGLFGAGGGSSAGIALLTLLGLACGWSLLAPGGRRAFRTSTARWRPSAYVPPIELPG
jgi:hypothetical protein